MPLNFIDFQMNQIKNNITLNILFYERQNKFKMPRYQWNLLYSINFFLVSVKLSGCLDRANLILSSQILLESSILDAPIHNSLLT